MMNSLIHVSEIKDLINHAIAEHERNKAVTRDVLNDYTSNPRGKKNMNFNVDHIYLTLNHLRGQDVTKFWQKWYAMVVTSNMSKEERNESLCPDTKDCLDLYAETFARIDAHKTSRVIPLPENWRDYENEDFSKLMKSYFYQIDSNSSSSLQSSYEDVSKDIGEKIVSAVLGWKDLKHLQSVTEVIVNLQKVLKDLQLIAANHNELISKILKTISNKTSDSRTSGSVALLNNLYSFLMKKSKEVNSNNASLSMFHDDVFEFLKQIISWTGSIVLTYNSNCKLGIESIPFQQNAPSLNNVSKNKESKNVTVTSKHNGNSNSSNTSAKGAKAPSKKSFNPEDFDKVPCRDCGRRHAIGYTKCENPTHPDLNKQRDKTWPESDMGKKYASLNLQFIHPYKRLNPEKTALISNKTPLFTKGNSIIYLNNFDNDSSNSFLSTFSLKNLRGRDMLHFNTLIDSGAVNSNFISRSAAETLQNAGYKVEECDSRVEMGVKGL